MPNFLLQLSFGIALLGILCQWAPGDPSWLSAGQVPEHPAPSIGQTVDYSLQTFQGGDGSTTLVGRFYPPLNSNNSNIDDDHDDDDDDTKPPPAATAATAPIVVMAHGLGLTQDCKLDAHIQAFRQIGLAVFTFDYATFGWSHGWPRHQVIPHRHVADLQAALVHVRKLPQIDTERIALWGTSLGGGHVLSVAAVDSNIRAVVANVPHVKSALESLLGLIRRDPIPALQGLFQVGGSLVKGVGSFLASMVTNQDGSTYIPLHGPPGSPAMLQNPGDDEGYGSLVENLPQDLQWRNLASVTSVLPTLFYRPYNSVKTIVSPTLFLPAELDTLCPAADSVAAAQLMNPDTTKLVMMKGKAHFDVYDGEGLDKSLHETITFFQEHVLRI